MSITRKLIENRHAVWALALAAGIFGFLAYRTMPMQLFPETAPPLVNVVTLYPGASAEEIGDNLSRLLEDEFASLEGIVTIKSTSRDNISVVSVEFLYTREVDQAALDVQNAISRIRATLPRGIKEPQVLKFSTSDRPIITVGIRSNNLREARRIAEDIVARRFQRVPGVAAVDVFGGARRAVLIDVDIARAKAYRIPLERLVKLVSEQNITLPGGSLRSERTATSYRVEARAETLSQLSTLPLLLPNGSRIELSDIASIREGTLEDDSRFSIGGKRHIALQIYKSDDANTVKVVEAVTALTKELSHELPGYTFSIGEESGSFTKISIGNLISNVWEALLLASLIIFLFIGRVRLSLVAVVSMPLAYGITFALMKMTNTEFNMVTLSAVILAVGMVVDAAVVILENISRLREEGLPLEEAVVQGADEVRLPVIAGTATTVAVLVPLLFTGGFTGKTFAPMALTLLFAFTSSVVVALVLVPVLALYTGEESRVDRLGKAVAFPFTWIMGKIQALYALLLRGGLRWRFFTILLTVGLFIFGLRTLAGQGMETLPKMDSGSFFISVETPSGTSLEETGRVVATIEELVRAEPQVTTIQSQIGFEEGMKSASSGASGPTQGFISVTLTPRTQRKETIWQIQQRVRKKILRVPGIRQFTVREQGNTAKSTTAAPVVVRISGKDPLVLSHLGDLVVQQLEKIDSVVQPVKSWRIDQKQAVVTVNRMRADQHGLTPAKTAALLQMGSSGAFAGEFHGRRDSPVPIQLRFARPKNSTSEFIMDYPVFSSGGGQIPLRALVALKEKKVQAIVTRENQTPTLDVTAFVEGRPMSFVTRDVSKALKKIPVPREYTLELTGEKKDMAEARAELGGAFLIALLAVYLLLVAQLRSFVHPLTIMMTIPLSLIGVAFALYIAQKPVSMPVMVGLILLVGTVVNNAIILIDFINMSRAKGSDLKTALMDSVAVRFRPIMMTSLSTVVGMIPLAGEWALGSERFAPLAVAVIGGMSAATLLTMVFIPVLYSIFDDIQRALTRLVTK